MPGYSCSEAVHSAAGTTHQGADWRMMARSYTRQSKDDTLYKTAIRIQARAGRRCSELMKQFDGCGGRLLRRWLFAPLSGAGCWLDQEQLGVARDDHWIFVPLASAKDS